MLTGTTYYKLHLKNEDQEAGRRCGELMRNILTLDILTAHSRAFSAFGLLMVSAEPLTALLERLVETSGYLYAYKAYTLIRFIEEGVAKQKKPP